MVCANGFRTHSSPSPRLNIIVVRSIGLCVGLFESEWTISPEIPVRSPWKLYWGLQWIPLQKSARLQFHSFIECKILLAQTRIRNSDGLDWYSSNCSILARHKRKRLITEVNWGQFGEYFTWFGSSQSEYSCLVSWVDELNVTSPFKGVFLHPSTTINYEYVNYIQNMFSIKVFSNWVNKRSKLIGLEFIECCCKCQTTIWILS